MYATRRERLLDTMGPGVAVFPAAPVALRNNDVEHDYRQHSDLYYLTGFDEPESVLVLTNQHPEHKAVLFVRKRDPEREVWDGPRAGVDGAVERFGVDAAFLIEELDEKLPEYLGGCARLHYAIGQDRAFDGHVLRALDVVRRKARRGTKVPSEIVDPSVTLHELRLRKGPQELETMRRAAAVTREAHLRAMKAALPGRHEYEVEAALKHAFRAHGSERVAYAPIVGSGPNATILHYVKNDRQMQDGELLLIDAGCELDYYAADVTRTFPVGGKFSEAQRAIYELVLRAERRAIAAVAPGATLDAIHDVALRTLVEGLIELGIVEGSVEEALEEKKYQPYYMHRTSHWLGMDVHDVGAYFVDGHARPLEPGMVLTVEPGLYIGVEAPCDPRWRGIGVRIEDDILVTVDGHENLTAEIPVEVEAIEALLAAR